MVSICQLPKINSRMKYSHSFLFVIFLIPVSTDLSYLSSLSYFLLFIVERRVIPYGLAVKIPGFHPGGPGSTPGMGIINYFSDIIGCFFF